MKGDFMKKEYRVYVINKNKYHGGKSLYHIDDEEFITIAETQDQILDRNTSISHGVFSISGFMREFRMAGLQPMPLPHIDGNLLPNCVIRIIEVNYHGAEPIVEEEVKPCKWDDINLNYIDDAMKAVNYVYGIAKPTIEGVITKDEDCVPVLGKTPQMWLDVINHLGVIKARKCDNATEFAETK
jgi:hypothetical protein